MEIAVFDCDNTPALLIGKTLEKIDINEFNDEMLFICTDGDAFRAYHMQDCCETVSIYDIKGVITDILGSKIIYATEDTSGDMPDDVSSQCISNDSFTWTTHKFVTENNKTLVVRWLGQSNGYYSESVYFQRTHNY